MRNYVAVNVAEIFIDDPNVGIFARQFCGTDPDDLLAWCNALLTNRPGIFSQYDVSLAQINDLGIWYILLDKANICALVNALTSDTSMSFNTRTGVGAAYQRDPFSDDAKFNPKAPPANSPRKGWKDFEGVTREPNPAPKGQTGPVSFAGLAQLLQTLYSVFYTRGLFAVAQDILRVLRDVLRGTVTQSEIDALFAELAKYG